MWQPALTTRAGDHVRSKALGSHTAWPLGTKPWIEMARVRGSCFPAVANAEGGAGLHCCRSIARSWLRLVVVPSADAFEYGLG